MVNSKNQIKVMDFGLAKLKGSLKLTQTLSTVGTLAYMSPEQINSSKVDARSDIFSFGVVLFEMLTGKMPFSGDYEAAIMYSILNEEPDPLQKQLPDAPSELLHILNRALEKDPQDRYQSTADLVSELQRLKKQTGRVSRKSLAGMPLPPKAQPDSAEMATIATSPRGKRMLTPAVWITGAVVLAAIVAFFAIRFTGETDNAATDFQEMEIKRLSTSGNVWTTAISGDGKYLVQEIREGNKSSLWLRQVETNSNVRIVSPEEGTYSGLNFSPDGNYIYYAKWEQNAGSGTLYKIPVLGGDAKQILSGTQSGVSLSPDGSEIAFIRRDRTKGVYQLVIASADGASERIIVEYPENNATLLPAWSPNGEAIAVFQTELQPVRNIAVLIIDVATGDKTTLTSTKWRQVAGLTWLPSGGLVTAARPLRANNYQLWHIAYPSGNIRRITNDLSTYRGVSVTDDGHALATTQVQPTANIWIQDGNRTNGARKVSTNVMDQDGIGGFAWAPDGRIILTSNASGNSDIWAMQPDGSNRRQLTTYEGADFFPAVPLSSGKHIVFTSVKSEGANIWRMDSDGRNLRQLTFGNIDQRPDVSPDGQWVIYWTKGTDREGLMKISIDGGEPVRVMEQPATFPAISPDGKWLAYGFRNEETGEWLTGVMPFAGGQVTHVFENQWPPIGWSPDSKGICYAKTNEEGGENLWLQPLDGGEPTQITHFEGDEVIPAFDWEPSGKRLAFVRYKTIHDAVLIRNFR